MGARKWELIYPQGPWTGLADVEFATLTYVDWFNDRRLHGEITPGPGYTTPLKREAPGNPSRSTSPTSRWSLMETIGYPTGWRLISPWRSWLGPSRPVRRTR